MAAKLKENSLWCGDTQFLPWRTGAPVSADPEKAGALGHGLLYMQTTPFP